MKMPTTIAASLFLLSFSLGKLVHLLPKAAVWSITNERSTLYLGSMLGFRIVEFAVPLLLITYFKDTLLPNAIYGFSSCGRSLNMLPTSST